MGRDSREGDRSKGWEDLICVGGEGVKGWAWRILCYLCTCEGGGQKEGLGEFNVV